MIDWLKSDAPRKAMAVMLALATVLGPTSIPAFAADHAVPNAGPATATPIKHLVVIFQENVSFDHYFGTYPVATNPASEPAFYAHPATPTVHGYSPAFLTHHP